LGCTGLAVDSPWPFRLRTGLASIGFGLGSLGLDPFHLWAIQPVKMLSQARKERGGLRWQVPPDQAMAGAHPPL